MYHDAALPKVKCKLWVCNLWSISELPQRRFVNKNRVRWDQEDLDCKVCRGAVIWMPPFRGHGARRCQTLPGWRRAKGKTRLLVAQGLSGSEAPGFTGCEERYVSHGSHFSRFDAKTCDILWYIVNIYMLMYYCDIGFGYDLILDVTWYYWISAFYYRYLPSGKMRYLQYPGISQISKMHDARWGTDVPCCLVFLGSLVGLGCLFSNLTERDYIKYHLVSLNIIKW